MLKSMLAQKGNRPNHTKCTGESGISVTYLPSSPLVRTIALQIQRLVKALTKERASFEQIIPIPALQFSSSPKTVATTINSSEVGMRHSSTKYMKFARCTRRISRRITLRRRVSFSASC
mmetsp:Transcript_23835/g.43066  ORF Transcript_23835/g.43066 Transcript_23835/m.43066 type:complete len:119 (-) Transcript_23835:341-697(-)